MEEERERFEVGVGLRALEGEQGDEYGPPARRYKPFILVLR